MSRLIIKNIPKQISETELKSHFEKIGPITDCRILFKEKKNRRIAFIGYKIESHASKAKEFFNNTYIYMSRINVDFAKTSEDPTLPRAWSKYSKGSSLYFSKHPNELPEKTQPSKKIKTISDESTPINAEKKAKFQEFLQLMSKKHISSMTDTMLEEKEPPKKKKIKKSSQKTVLSNGNQVIITEIDDTNLKAGVSNKRVHIKLGPESMKKEEINQIFAKKKEEKQEKPEKPQETAEKKLDEKRLYVINLPFNSTEEEIKEIFEKYGKVTEIKLPKDKEGKFKGFAYISYENEEQALHAFAALDNKIVMGRILHLRPSYAPIETNKKTDENEKKKLNDEKTSFKKSKKKEMLEKLNDKTNWNSLFLNPNSVLAAIAAQYNIKKRDILEMEASDQAVKIALAETQIMNETKEWLESQGLNLDFLDESPEKCVRSDKIILVKNIAAETKEQQLKELFEYYGSVSKFLLCPNNSIGIVQFENSTFAENAFKNLSYYKFKGEPLYLEWAPIDLLETTNEKNEKNNENLEEFTKNLREEAEESNEDRILFIKNLNFKTNENDLKGVFREKFTENEIVSVKIIKKNGLSQGYGFIEFKTRELASKALKTLQNVLVDDHALKLSLSKKPLTQKKKTLKRKRDEMEPNNKIIVRNIAFEATKDDILSLFKTYGEVKSVRLPKKMNRQHRGFAFVEFTSIEEANKAFRTLQNTHLYGRKLVLEWAEQELKASMIQ